MRAADRALDGRAREFRGDVDLLGAGWALENEHAICWEELVGNCRELGSLKETVSGTVLCRVWLLLSRKVDLNVIRQ